MGVHDNAGWVFMMGQNMQQADNAQLVSLGESLDKANIIVTLTDHSVFKQVKQSVLQEKVIINARGIWE